MKTIRILSISEEPKFILHVLPVRRKLGSTFATIEKYRYITGVDVETGEKVVVRIRETNVRNIVNLEGKPIGSIRVGDTAKIDGYTIGRHKLPGGIRLLFNPKVFQILRSE